MSNIKVVDFIKQVKQEGQKISYPAKQEVLMTVIIVMVILVIFSLFFLAVDTIIFKLIQLILRIEG